MHTGLHSLRRRAVVFRTGGVAIGLASAFLTLLLWSTNAISPVIADSASWYVDTASGQDTGSCGSSTDPCETISHTIGMRAEDGDTICVAQGTYTENLTINKKVVLMGGYEAGSWSRDLSAYETIIDGSAGKLVLGDWDGQWVGKPTVLSDTTELKLWYDGRNVLGTQQVGLATSTDGISWTKYLSNPVLTGTVGQWDEHGERAAFVLKEGGVYKMWYEGSDGDVRQLGYATSGDGVNWTKHPGNPVLAAGPESYDRLTAGHGSVINDRGVYKLWYHAVGDSGPLIAYATSSDGISWVKQGPVLIPEPGQWDEFALWGPSVLVADGLYWMWYTGAGQSPPAIGVVTSTNGITWTRFLTGPVISKSDSFLADPNVITSSGKLRMWFYDHLLGQINYAESNDGISWTEPFSNPVLTPGTPVADWGKPVISVQADQVELDGLTIRAGSSRYAGGVEAGTNTTIRDSIIRNNFADGAPDSQGGGGMQAFAGATVTVVNTQIIVNSVNQGAGGIRAGESTLVMTNSIVADNRGDLALHLNNGARLWHSTIVNNDDGVLINAEGKPDARLEIVNSIIFSNGNSIFDAAGTVQVSYSDIEGRWPGTGNITDTPEFVDPAGGDYHLSSRSAAIDAGTNSEAPATDIEGDPRPMDGDVDGNPVADMGADEYSPPRVLLPSVQGSTAP